MFTSLTKNILHRIQRAKKSAFIHYQTAKELRSTIQEISYMHLNHLLHGNQEFCLACNHILTTGLHTIKSTTTK